MPLLIIIGLILFSLAYCNPIMENAEKLAEGYNEAMQESKKKEWARVRKKRGGGSIFDPIKAD